MFSLNLNGIFVFTMLKSHIFNPPQTASTAVPLTSQHPLEKAHVVASSFPLFTNNIQDRGAYKQKFSNCFFIYIFSGKNTLDNHISTLIFVICRLPVA